MNESIVTKRRKVTDGNSRLWLYLLRQRSFQMTAADLLEQTLSDADEATDTSPESVRQNKGNVFINAVKKRLPC